MPRVIAWLATLALLAAIVPAAHAASKSVATPGDREPISRPAENAPTKDKLESLVNEGDIPLGVEFAVDTDGNVMVFGGEFNSDQRAALDSAIKSANRDTIVEYRSAIPKPQADYGGSELDGSNHYGGARIVDNNNGWTQCTTGFQMEDWHQGVQKGFTTTAFHCSAYAAQYQGKTIWWWSDTDYPWNPFDSPGVFVGGSDSYGRSSQWGDVRIVTSPSETYGGTTPNIPPWYGPRIYIENDEGQNLTESHSAIVVDKEPYVNGGTGISHDGQNGATHALVAQFGHFQNETTGWYFWADYWFCDDPDELWPGSPAACYWTDTYQKYDDSVISLSGHSGGPWYYYDGEPSARNVVALGVHHHGYSSSNCGWTIGGVHGSGCDVKWATDINRLEAITSGEVATAYTSVDPEQPKGGLALWQ